MITRVQNYNDWSNRSLPGFVLVLADAAEADACGVDGGELRQRLGVVFLVPEQFGLHQVHHGDHLQPHVLAALEVDGGGGALGRVERPDRNCIKSCVIYGVG